MIKPGDTVEWSPVAHGILRGEVILLTRAGESPRAAALRVFGCHLAELDVNGWRGIEFPSRPRQHALAIVRVVKIGNSGKPMKPRYYIPKQTDLRVTEKAGPK